METSRLSEQVSDRASREVAGMRMHRRPQRDAGGEGVQAQRQRQNGGLQKVEQQKNHPLTQNFLFILCEVDGCGYGNMISSRATSAPTAAQMGSPSSIPMQDCRR